MKNKTRPIIGFTLDYEQGGKSGNFSKMPHYAIRENYLTAVSSLGAIPLPLPHETGMVSDYLDLIDGLIITGGGFDVSPEYYGEKVASDKVTTKDKRTEFEFAITKGAIERKIPILGICGGEQLLNVVLGGTLIQHIPDSIKDALEHEQKNARTEPGHEIEIFAGTLLHRIITSPLRGEVGASRREGVVAEGKSASRTPSKPPLTPSLTLPPLGGGNIMAAVNSAHHQAVAKPAPGTIVNSKTSDGVIEGIELPTHPFCLGVQWHPEYFVSPIDKKIFEAFISICRGEGLGFGV